MTCSPSPMCRCCVCQGKHCLVNHPGHSHADPAANRVYLTGEQLVRILTLATDDADVARLVKEHA
jgi:hypothetical protein